MGAVELGLLSSQKRAIGEKLAKPETAGEANQVLTSDGNGGQVWAAIGQGEITVDSTLSVAGSAADAKATGDEISDLKSAIDSIDSDLYTDVEEELALQSVNQYWAAGVGYEVETAQGRKVSVEGLSKVKVITRTVKWYDVYDFLDANGDVISYQRNTGSTADFTLTLDVPATAKYIVASTSSATGAESIRMFKFVKTDRITIQKDRIDELTKDIETIGVTIKGNAITVDQMFNGSVMHTNCLKVKDANGNKNFGFTSYTGSFQKTASDDSCPLYYNGGYKGGGHGDDNGMSIAATAHGKTIADIGSQYKGANDVIVTIIRIVDEDTLWVIGEPYDDVLTTRVGRRFKGTVPTSPLVHVSDSGGTNMDNIASFTVTNNQQIWPSINNHSLKFVADGEVLTNDGEYTCQRFDVMEEYGIIDTYQMYLDLKANVGNNTNDSYYADSIDDEVLYLVDYSFTADGGCYIDSSITAIRDNITGLFYGITQAQQAYTKTYIPFSTTFATPTTQNADIELGSSQWADSDFPPYKFYQIGTSDCFAIGYDITVGDGILSKRITECDRAYYSPNQSKKMYPYIVHGLYPTQYQKVCGHAYRVPAVYANNMIAFHYPSGSYDVIEMEFMAAKEGEYALPSRMNGKHIEVVKASSTVHIVEDIVINGSIRYIVTGAGSCTLKIT